MISVPLIWLVLVVCLLGAAFLAALGYIFWLTKPRQRLNPPTPATRRERTKSEREVLGQIPGKRDQVYRLSHLIEGIDMAEGRSPFPPEPGKKWRTSDRIALILKMACEAHGISVQEVHRRAKEMGDHVTDGSYGWWCRVMESEGLLHHMGTKRVHRFFRTVNAKPLAAERRGV